MLTALIVEAVVLGMLVMVGHRIWVWRHALHASRRLGRYRLRARLGAGMNEVWLAWDDRDHREVALKLLRTTSAQEVTRARFAREAELVDEVRSSHTARVLDHGHDDGFAYIAMEYLRGLDLDALVRRQGPLDVARALHLMRQACRGLADAHRAGVVHRDVKPANLHCSDREGQEDTLHLLDFGVARRLGSARVTLDGVVIGTPSFMPPEAFAGEALTPASDVYALGCTFYFAITGATPFGEDDAAELRDAHRFAPIVPPSLRGHFIELPRPIERVILRAMAKDPRDRYPDAAAMGAALDAVAHESGPWTAADAARCWQRARTAPISTRPPTNQRTVS